MEVDTNEQKQQLRYCDTTKIDAPRTLEDLINKLHKVFEDDEVNVEYVQKLMTSYESNRTDWKKFAKFDRHRYTRNLVDEGNGKFNLMLLCWNESQGSSIHSHANSHCFMKVLDGSVQEQRFEWPNQSSDEQTQMKYIETQKFKKNETAYICDELGLHRVENPSHSDKAVTLHLYSPAFDECQCFDEKTGHSTSSTVTFWSKFGERTPYGKCCAPVDMKCAENN
ncbi:cysteine dioxygenase type 1-like [Mizuhopecten yessoensis]|uniref:Cysteine dioxygenase n=1 Tax=Mizuhopecten yessoensis TaxID=6573 RepID=A0A210QMP1_MIZYE|nr:cysteine dioxygenase type 1-like [Mizuhopecten yessoensis]OWF49971.1 Cysteine dioxygenase type 1 [Mizuhopecten yessoensis]